MIQRKQTVFLFSTILFLILLFIFPSFSFKKDGEEIPLLIYGMGELQTNFLVLILLNVSSIVLLAVIIFLYKNRTKQIFLCRVSTFLIAGLIVAIFYFAENVKKNSEVAGFLMEMQPALVAPIAALLLVILANRAIRKDEELVRSADRLR